MENILHRKNWDFAPIDISVKATSLEGVLMATGRALYSLVFITSSFWHFNPAAVTYATNQGLLAASFFVPLSGLLILAGGLSVLLGYHARLGALALAFFLVPTTLIMHRFWGLDDAYLAAHQQSHFIKNTALLGASLLICYFGSGPASVDAARLRRQKTVKIE